MRDKSTHDASMQIAESQPCTLSITTAANRASGCQRASAQMLLLLTFTNNITNPDSYTRIHQGYEFDGNGASCMEAVGLGIEM